MLLNFGKKPRSPRALGTLGQWLRNIQAAVRSATEREVIIDMTCVEAVNSLEMREIARIQLALREDGRQLILQNAQPQVDDLFELTRMNRLVEVQPLSSSH